MATRCGWRLMWMAGCTAALLVSAPAAAQVHDYGLKADSLGVAADTVRLPAQRMREMACDPYGLRVVRDTADLRAIERFRGCDASAFPALGRDLYVRVSMHADCRAWFDARAYRSDTRREYRVVMLTRYGGCRAAGHGAWWLRLPPLPDGWTVAFSDEEFPDGEELPLDWWIRP